MAIGAVFFRAYFQLLNATAESFIFCVQVLVFSNATVRFLG
ncbi:hypothetical protein B4113_2464 [Geobacillus sp. B4113_201601]|nr:hypothetical protein B4113_2464 [Geobacillus sp. B4113_201601]